MEIEIGFIRSFYPQLTRVGRYFTGRGRIESLEGASRGKNFAFQFEDGRQLGVKNVEIVFLPEPITRFPVPGEVVCFSRVAEGDLYRVAVWGVEQSKPPLYRLVKRIETANDPQDNLCVIWMGYDLDQCEIHSLHAVPFVKRMDEQCKMVIQLEYLAGDVWLPCGGRADAQHADLIESVRGQVIAA